MSKEQKQIMTQTNSPTEKKEGREVMETSNEKDSMSAPREGECQYCGNELKNRKTSCFDCLEEENQRLTAENLRYKAALEYIEQRAWAIEPKENAWKRVNDFCELAREALRGSK